MVVAAAGVAAAGSIGAAAISSSKKGGSSGGSASASSTQLPTESQGRALDYGFDQARSLYDQRTKAGPYQGGYYAGINDTQRTALSDAANWTQGAGRSLQNQAANTAGLQGYAGTYGGNAAGMAAWGTAGPDRGTMGALSDYANTGQMRGAAHVDGALSAALNGSAVQGAQAISGYNAGLGRAMDAAFADPTAQLASQAGQYMTSAPIQAALDNAHARIDATLNETTLPGLNRQASLGGNLNSSRAGMAEAMANRDAAIAKGNVDAQILNNAWNTGLATAAGQRTAGLEAGISAANAGLSGSYGVAQGVGNFQQGQRQFDTSSRIAAGQGALVSALGYGQLDAQTRLQANAQLGTGIGLGLQAGQGAANLATTNAGLALQAGGVLQQDEQGTLEDAYQRWAMQNGYGQGVLNDYWGIVGKTLYGHQSSTSSQSKLPGNTAGTIAGIAAGLGSQFTKGGLFEEAGKQVKGWFGGSSSDPTGGLFGGAGVDASTPGYDPTGGFGS